MVLVYEGKHDREYFDASTEGAKEKTFKKLFKNMKEMSYYDYLENIDDHISDIEKNIAKNKDLARVLRAHGETSSAEREESHVKKMMAEIQETKAQKALYDLAKKGNKVALEKFLNRRNQQGYQYETFTICRVQ